MSLETQIQDLCGKAVKEEDPEELNRILSELKAALHQYIENMRTSVGTEYPLHLERDVA